MTYISEDHYKVSLVFCAVARELENSAGRYTDPAQSTDAIRELHGAHKHIVGALERLHTWHTSARPGQEYEAGDQGSIQAMGEAAAELAAAAVTGQAVVEALHRASQASSRVRCIEHLGQFVETGSGADDGVPGGRG